LPARSPHKKNRSAAEEMQHFEKNFHDQPEELNRLKGFWF
jgi:hypothetical protein